MSGSSEPTFKHGRWISAYSWENAPTQQFRSGNQAISISTVRKQKQKRGTPVKLYVCKWYKTAGVGLTGTDGDKYIFQEWKTFRSLQHPNIVAYEDFSYDPNGARMAKLYMEYCPGGDLRLFQNAGSQDNRLGVDEGLQILEQLAQALLYIHHGISKTADRLQLARPADSEPALSHDGKASEWNSILHRDVKPENVFISHRDTNLNLIAVKLGDFGIAKFQTDGTDTYVGSREFLAPEQRHASHNPRQTSIKSDIYALGVTMRKVTKVDAQSGTTASSSETRDHRINNFQRLLDQCVHSEEQHRPSSAVIIDSIPSIGKDSPPPIPLLSQAACGLIEWDTRGATANARKKARMGLSSQLLLCNRLLLAGCIPGNAHVENRPLLKHAVSFLNRNLEALGSSPANGGACPGWKGSAVERLISFLRKHDASEMPQGHDEYVVPYDIGNDVYQSLEAASMAQRRQLLLEIVKQRFPAQYLAYPHNDALFLRGTTYLELLSFTSSNHHQASLNLAAKMLQLQNLEEKAESKAQNSDPGLTLQDLMKGRFQGPAKPTGRLHDHANGFAGLSSAPSRHDDGVWKQAGMDAFKKFAQNEKLRLRAAQEARRSNARHEKNIKLNDLKQFAKDLTLKTRVPDDIIPILAKDHEKQLEIKRKAEENYRLAERKMKDGQDVGA